MVETKVKSSQTVKRQVAPKAPQKQQKNNVAEVKQTAIIKPKASELKVCQTPKEEKVTVNNINQQQQEQPKAQPIKKSILFVASEAQPFCATGGLADIACGLPRFIKSQKPEIDIRVILPLYSFIKPEYKNKFTYLGNKYVKLSWRNEYCGIFEYKLNGMTYYFVDNEKYFKRDRMYGYNDDNERFAFFSKAVLESLSITNFFPDIIHVNDWQTALIPTYLKTIAWQDGRYNRIKTVLNIHNLQYQGRFGIKTIEDVIGIDRRYQGILEQDGDVNYLKSAIVTADRIVAVSPSYSEEIKYSNSGCGLNKIIKQNEYKLSGILNGLDYDFYNPETDNIIYKNYNINSIELRKENKMKLQKDWGLEVNPDIPMVAIVSRMEKHKGLDLVKQCMEKLIIENNIQLVGVGEGANEYHDYFRYLNNKFPKQCHINIGYSLEIGKIIYSATDIFVMPSLVEPCGLAQMVASRYGAVPIVRETGGLKDSIRDFGCKGGGNGYTFSNYSVSDLVYSIKRALNDFKDKKSWEEKIKTVMKVDFSWDKTAQKYIEIYFSL